MMRKSPTKDRWGIFAKGGILMEIIHPLKPVFDADSRVLILGTMPSPRSREVGFYYGHPQNRFWKVMAQLFNEALPTDTEERTAFLKRHHIALWDVLQQCEITGAQDSSIRNPVANDLSQILDHAPIRAIFATGKTAGKWYTKLIQPQTGIPITILPSTSPANCAVSMEGLLQEYGIIRKYLEL